MYGCRGASACASGAGVTSENGVGGYRSLFPSLGGVLRVMNSVVEGSLSPAWRSAGEVDLSCRPHERSNGYKPSRASSSRIGVPPISKITRPMGTL